MNKNITLLKIESLLEQKKWTIYKLSKESEIPYSSLNNLFLRNTEPTLSTLRKICTGFGITLSDFFSDIDTPLENYTLEERKLISLYRTLKIPDKKLLMTYAQALNKEMPN